MTNAVELTGVTKTYPGAGMTKALDQVTVAFQRGTFTAVMGPSGSGKSTLLQCAAGLDRPDTGQVWLGGKEIGNLKEPKLTQERRKRAGFVFQAYKLDGLTVLVAQRVAAAAPVRGEG